MVFKVAGAAILQSQISIGRAVESKSRPASSVSCDPDRHRSLDSHAEIHGESACGDPSSLFKTSVSDAAYIHLYSHIRGHWGSLCFQLCGHASNH